MLDRFNREKIHTALETCGVFGPLTIPELTRRVDLFLFDLKHIDPDRHGEYTGVSNASILSNFKEVYRCAGNDRVVARVPLIPGFNTDADAVDGLISYLHDTDYHGPVHLMPYNKMARTKYEKIGLGHRYKDMGDLASEEIQAIITRFKNNGLEATVSS